MSVAVLEAFRLESPFLGHHLTLPRRGRLPPTEPAAALLHVSPRTMEELRRTRTGPPWRRMGRYVRYLCREVLVWFEDLDSDG